MDDEESVPLNWRSRVVPTVAFHPSNTLPFTMPNITLAMSFLLHMLFSSSGAHLEGRPIDVAL